MTSQAGQSPSLMNVQDVELQDSKLSWTYSADKNKDSATEDEILFVIAVSDRHGVSGQRHIICCLRENAESESEPFRLSLLATDSLPNEFIHKPCLRGLPDHLQTRDGNQVDVVVSTKSGVGKAPAFWQIVLRPLLRIAAGQVVQTGQDGAADPCNVIVTEDAQSVRRFARSLNSISGNRTVMLISGDGGVVDLLNGHEGEPGSPLPLIALLPLGTGNALFHSLHKPCASEPGPSPLVLGLRTLFLGTAAELPVFKASFSQGAHIVSYTSPQAEGKTSGDETSSKESISRQDTAVSSLYGAIVASYGFHASIVYESDTPEYRVHGDKRFGMVAKQLLEESHAYKADLDVRSSHQASWERDPHDTHGYVLVSMVSNLERKFTISPSAKPLDGKLHLVQFGAVGAERTMEAMMKAYDGGKHVDLKWDDGEKVRYEEVEEVKVVAQEDDERWRKFCIDGTIVEVPRGGYMTVGLAERPQFRVLVDSRVAAT